MFYPNPVRVFGYLFFFSSLSVTATYIGVGLRLGRRSMIKSFRRLRRGWDNWGVPVGGVSLCKGPLTNYRNHALHNGVIRGGRTTHLVATTHHYTIWRYTVLTYTVNKKFHCYWNINLFKLRFIVILFKELVNAS